MDGFVDAQIRNSEILLEFVQTYPGFTTAVIAVGAGLIVGFLGFAIWSSLNENANNQS